VALNNLMGFLKRLDSIDVTIMVAYFKVSLVIQLGSLIECGDTCHQFLLLVSIL